ncbi:MAG: class I SAM-dependent methyltransferase [Ferruginibacter sp.]
MNSSLREKLKPWIAAAGLPGDGGISVYMDPVWLTGDNARFMKMYNWMSYGYDFVENTIGRLQYGRSIAESRQAMMNRLEWKDHASVLYVSIGTGTDLLYIPETIDTSTLSLMGADISMGMLKKCKKRFSNKFNLSLVNCCAEDLPFADESFDIVFHIGGINFFSDKARAIHEMIRVARRGTKILIADETADYIDKQYKKSWFSRKHFRDKTFNLEALEKLIPSTVAETKTELLWENRFYCISFRK